MYLLILQNLNVSTSVVKLPSKIPIKLPIERPDSVNILNDTGKKTTDYQDLPLEHSIEGQQNDVNAGVLLETSFVFQFSNCKLKERSMKTPLFSFYCSFMTTVLKFAIFSCLIDYLILSAFSRLYVMAFVSAIPSVLRKV